jgi:hypothetical protein
VITAVKCRWLIPGIEQFIPVEACHACADDGRNPCGYPAPLIQVMTRNRPPEEVAASSTMFGSCLRQQGIQVHEDYAVDPDTSYTRAFGTLVHTGAETIHKNRLGTAQVEQRYRRTLVLNDGRSMTVTAAMDILHVDSKTGHAVIRDYKVVPSISNSEVGRRLAHHVPQFSIQRWILDAQGIIVDDIDLIFLSHKGRRVVNLFPEGDPELPNSYVMNFAATERYLQERGPELLDNLTGEYSEPLSDRETLWRCNYCDVRAQCEALYGKPIPASQKEHSGRHQ